MVTREAEAGLPSSVSVILGMRLPKSLYSTDLPSLQAPPDVGKGSAEGAMDRRTSVGFEASAGAVLQSD
jgi:hypothetical protein